MNQYTIKRFAGDWDQIPVIDIDTVYLDTPDTIKAWAQIAYDEKGIHVHQWTVEENYRAEEKGPLGSPCEDSCLEFFFAMDPEDPRYINMEFNPNGCLYLGFGKNGNTPGLIRMTVSADAVFAPKISREEKGWEITYCVPYSFITMFFPKFKAEPGTVIHANVYKCADKSQPPHYMSWSPITTQQLSFHRRECFGLMRFE